MNCSYVFFQEEALYINIYYTKNNYIYKHILITLVALMALVLLFFMKKNYRLKKPKKIGNNSRFTITQGDYFFTFKKNNNQAILMSHSVNINKESVTLGFTNKLTYWIDLYEITFKDTRYCESKNIYLEHQDAEDAFINNMTISSNNKNITCYYEINYLVAILGFIKLIILYLTPLYIILFIFELPNVNMVVIVATCCINMIILYLQNTYNNYPNRMISEIYIISFYVDAFKWDNAFKSLTPIRKILVIFLWYFTIMLYRFIFYYLLFMINKLCARWYFQILIHIIILIVINHMIHPIIINMYNVFFKLVKLLKPSQLGKVIMIDNKTNTYIKRNWRNPRFT